MKAVIFNGFRECYLQVIMVVLCTKLAPKTSEKKLQLLPEDQHWSSVIKSAKEVKMY